MLDTGAPLGPPDRSGGGNGTRGFCRQVGDGGNAIYTEFATPGAISVDLGHKRFSVLSVSLW